MASHLWLGALHLSICKWYEQHTLHAPCFPPLYLLNINAYGGREGDKKEVKKKWGEEKEEREEKKQEAEEDGGRLP